MLYMIGLGLGDAKDITVKGLEVLRRCSRVYLEAYTSVLTVGKEVLEEFYGRKLILADREEVEQEANNILKDADISDVAFLVVGDPFGATTHSDLILRATKLGIPYRVIHNASIMNAVGCCGLQLYRFGETVSVVFWTDTWRPESFFDKVKKNRQNGMHTLCLLVWKWLGSLSLYTKLVVLIELQKGWAAFVSRDIKVKEQSLENLIKGRKIYEPPHYMSVNQAAQQLLEIVQNQRIRGEEPAVTEETLCVGLARVGAEDQKIAAGTLQQMCTVDLGGPLHSLIITGGSLHPLEMEMLSLFSIPEKSSESQSIDGL
ncbi:diphthine methyl ester synthase isoform X1 [Lagenorhynchus albirostris]|uniref:diphthine methyl ester synthase isoform X1 n=1 Tax=Lagenorhynchus albirostris TaxID=27610 RepID=UPI0028E19A16|nr:diphthine methyl ester synthase isoform X1 [Lagenorhynchus albirostris]XP_059995480.1 diphthine methyl ester synthase isoform X1 [Lagenorhynchus albirostris]